MNSVLGPMISCLTFWTWKSTVTLPHALAVVTLYPWLSEREKAWFQLFVHVFNHYGIQSYLILFIYFSAHVTSKLDTNIILSVYLPQQ